MMYRCYLRVSTEDKGQTVESQKTAVDEWLLYKKIPEDEIKWYEDIISGAKWEREGLDELLEDVEKDDVLVVRDLSRIGRSMRDTIPLIFELTDDKGIHLVSIKEGMDSRIQMKNRLAWVALVGMMCAFAEIGRITTSESTKDGLVRVRKEGKTLGRPRTINRKKVLELVGSGMTKEQVARRMNISKKSVTLIVKASLK